MKMKMKTQSSFPTQKNKLRISPLVQGLKLIVEVNLLWEMCYHTDIGMQCDAVRWESSANIPVVGFNIYVTS